MADTATVLVVDDDPQICDMLRDYLAEHGYEVLIAGDGAAARSLLAEQIPHVVLLDVGLPGEDGLSLARHLRENYDIGIIMVSDEGSGIAPEVMERMFEPFFTTKEVGKGSGMGLATVHGIVHEYGGHILVGSTPGVGTTFRVLLPALKSAAAVETKSADASAHASRRPQLDGRVLVVDDEAAVAEFMQDLLAGWGLEVTALNSPVAARDAFAQNPHAFDLILLDQTMPGLTGLELAQDMLLLRPALPVVLYTGYREALDDETVRKVGIRAVVRKPVDVDELHALIGTLLIRPT